MKIDNNVLVFISLPPWIIIKDAKTRCRADAGTDVGTDVGYIDYFN